jgi:programmed cell death 6-interacting protein
LAETARLEREFPMQKIEAVQFEGLFEQRLQRYDDDRIMVSNEREEQEDLSSRLQETNAAFVSLRRGDSSSRERENALQRLENAYLKYKEILSNLDTGRKFYNDLAKLVTRFKDECREFRYRRRIEAGQLET